MPRIARSAAFAVLLALLAGAVSLGQSQPPPAVSAAEKGKVMLTIFLRHDESKPLGKIQEELEQGGFWEKFPPLGVEVVSWYVMMGIGQVVTLRFPAEKLRDVNLAIEQSAWGAYRTEFYPTYDYRAMAEAEVRKHRK